jgi:hypothetical protein
VREMIMGENYERNITLIRSDISRFSRGTIEPVTRPQSAPPLPPSRKSTVDSERFNCGQRRRSHWLGSLYLPRLRNRAMTDLMQRCLQRYPPRSDSQDCRRHHC